MLENFRLKVFRAVAEHLSFRKAGEVLYLTQPAVTQQIKTLEEELGTKLFERSASGVRLSQAGNLLLQYAGQLHEITQRAEDALSQLKGEAAGDLVLGALLKVGSKTAFLVTAGTAICGGSAIAAIAPVLDPDEDELAMSMGTVFTLNAVALFLFPLIGLALHLTQTQFGLWSALAIHDTSSVVGAAARFGPKALAVATVVKLMRALWIIPVALLTAWTRKTKARIRMPWFIVFFCLAAFVRASFRGMAPLFGAFVRAAHIGMALTLFLIGTGISAATVRRAGIRVMAQGVLLWILAAAVSLFAIHAGWIRIS